MNTIRAFFYKIRVFCSILKKGQSRPLSPSLSLVTRLIYCVLFSSIFGLIGQGNLIRIFVKIIAQTCKGNGENKGQILYPDIFYHLHSAPTPLLFNILFEIAHFCLQLNLTFFDENDLINQPYFSYMQSEIFQYATIQTS